MPITEQQAIEWAGSATADQLTTIQSFRPDGRLTADLCRQMMLVSTGVAHCFLAGGPQPPIFNWPPGSAQEEGWCQAFLRRDGRKRQTLDGTQSSKTTLANKKAADDPPFFMSFGHQSNIRAWENHFPFLQFMFDPDISDIMYRYVAEEVQWMMKGGGSHSNFQHLLWVGLRDWNTSSAWTRGVVLIYARRYKQLVQEAHNRHQQVQQHQIDSWLASLGFNPQDPVHSLAHRPSLTARQARRSGVSQEALRRRWE